MAARPPKLSPTLLPGLSYPFGTAKPAATEPPQAVPVDVLRSGQTLSGALGYDLPTGINRSIAARRRMLRRVAR